MTESERQPYRALAASVIWQAVADAVLAEKCDKKSAAAGWLMSLSEAPLTFAWWCAVANLDEDNIRRTVVANCQRLAWQIERGLSVWMEVDDDCDL